VEFSTVSLLSVVGFWIIWRRGQLAAFAPAWGIALGWMLSTIAFFLFSRFRLPAVPGLLIVSSMSFVAVDDARRRGERRWLFGGFLMAGSLLLPYLPGPKGRVDLVESNLGRLADDRGDSAIAERHYRAALEADPTNFLASLNLGTLAARRQDWPAALTFYRRAVSLEPKSDDAECNLGGVLLAMGNSGEAETHLDRALALNPSNTTALQNKAVLLLRQGNLVEARAINQRLLDLEPDNAPALRMRERLAKASANGG
jgi:tetratricopeptide (TPR) repeat protein